MSGLTRAQQSYQMKKLLLETNAEDNAVNAAFMKDVLTPIVDNLNQFEAFADWDSCEATGINLDASKAQFDFHFFSCNLSYLQCASSLLC